jgi:hypothetical protein
MTSTRPIRTVDHMINPLRRHRDHYLDRLATEPWFEGVPRHLLPCLGRSVDALHLRLGTSVPCDPERQTVLVADGHAVVFDPTAPVGAATVVGAGALVGHGDASNTTGCRLIAVTPVRAYVIARRELPMVMSIARRVEEAMTRRALVEVIGLDRADDAGSGARRRSA